MNTLPFIIYADLYQDLRKRAQVIGYATASYSAASIVGPLIGGWIVDTFSWHWVFYINVPIALVSILCVRYFFKEQPKTHLSGSVDLLGRRHYDYQFGDVIDWDSNDWDWFIDADNWVNRRRFDLASCIIPSGRSRGRSNRTEPVV